jgi:hypothetical protein
MADDPRQFADTSEAADERALRELFAEPGPQSTDPPPPPERDLVGRALQQAHTEIAAKDWIDFATNVLVLRFFVPILELIMGSLDPTARKERDDG